MVKSEQHPQRVYIVTLREPAIRVGSGGRGAAGVSGHPSWDPRPLVGQLVQVSQHLVTKLCGSGHDGSVLSMHLEQTDFNDDSLEKNREWSFFISKAQSAEKVRAKHSSSRHK